MKGNIDEWEESMVFDSSPTYEEVVMTVRNVLNWIDPNDKVKLNRRYDVGVGVKSRLKSMPIASELHWKAYKDKVVESQDKSLELLYATKIELPVLQIDLNRHATSLIHDGRVEVYVPNSSSQPPNEAEMNDRAMVTGKERGAPLFHDLILVDKAVVDGGMRLGLFEPTPCTKVSDPKPKDEDENVNLKKGIKFG
ncbi:hypothetical protein D1007_18045 [Hordeum vulgare]|nr:hypothetical protein D1007_18045 [Hordeum vulgare]